MFFFLDFVPNKDGIYIILHLFILPFTFGLNQNSYTYFIHTRPISVLFKYINIEDV